MLLGCWLDGSPTLQPLVSIALHLVLLLTGRRLSEEAPRAACPFLPPHHPRLTTGLGNVHLRLATHASRRRTTAW